MIRRGFLHDTHEFVAKDVAFLHGWNVTVVDVQVRPADRRAGHAQNDVARILDLGIRDRLVAHVALAVPTEGFHGGALNACQPSRVKEGA